MKCQDSIFFCLILLLVIIRTQFTKTSFTFISYIHVYIYCPCVYECVWFVFHQFLTENFSYFFSDICVGHPTVPDSSDNCHLGTSSGLSQLRLPRHLLVPGFAQAWTVPSEDTASFTSQESVVHLYVFCFAVEDVIGLVIAFDGGWSSSLRNGQRWDKVQQHHQLDARCAMDERETRRILEHKLPIRPHTQRHTNKSQ